MPWLTCGNACSPEDRSADNSHKASESALKFLLGYSTTDKGMDEGSARASAASDELTSCNTAASERESSFSAASSRVCIGVTFGFGGALLCSDCFADPLQPVRTSRDLVGFLVGFLRSCL
jgi:hypothetical protein